MNCCGWAILPLLNDWLIMPELIPALPKVFPARNHAPIIVRDLNVGTPAKLIRTIRTGQLHGEGGRCGGLVRFQPRETRSVQGLFDFGFNQLARGGGCEMARGETADTGFD